MNDEEKNAHLPSSNVMTMPFVILSAQIIPGVMFVSMANDAIDQRARLSLA
jgi:hypothetical protein